jgi:hypothetical protein
MTLKLSSDAVLAEFALWLAEQPDTPARRWVEGNMPGRDDTGLTGFALAA